MWRVIDLIASGVSDRVLVVILEDGEKEGALMPLIIALRGRMGEDVRAPEEVLEVAADIRERIEERVG